MRTRTEKFNRRAARALAGGLTCLWLELACGATVVTGISASSLQEAIAVGGPVYFATTGAVLVASTITITRDVWLIDSNHSVVISGTRLPGQGPLLRVEPGVQFGASGLTFANGLTTNGGAIYSAGTTVLTDCLFSNNVALGHDGVEGANGSFGTRLGTGGSDGKPGMPASGGALYNLGTSFVFGCTFLTNQAIGGRGGTGGTGGQSDYQGGDGGSGSTGGRAAGGAIYSTGFLQVSNSLFRLNAARGGGGGRGGTSGAAPLAGADGDGGAGGSAVGGAVYALNGTIVSTTFHNNSALAGNSAAAATNTPHFLGVMGRQGPDAHGGGMRVDGTLDLENCTFATNSVTGGNGGSGGNGNPYGGDGGDGGSAWGGSVHCGTDATLNVTNCTLVAGSVTPGAGGSKGAGLLAEDGGAGRARGANLANEGTSFLKNTLVAYPANNANVHGEVFNLLGNLSSDGTPANFPDARRNVDPLLLPLAFNGGSTPTLSPKTASPAVNAGHGEGAPVLDQRGYPRDGDCDVGAVELQISRTPSLNIVAASTNQLILYWPAWASQYSPRSARTLVNSPWAPMTNLPRAQGELLTLPLPLNQTNRVQFFRLQAQ